MPVTREELEAAIGAAIQVTHVNVEDNSGGCGEKYSVLIVSKVLLFQVPFYSYRNLPRFTRLLRSQVSNLSRLFLLLADLGDAWRKY